MSTENMSMSMFSKEKIDKIVKKMPSGTKGALLGGVTDEGAQVVVRLSLADGDVKVSGVYQYDWDDRENHVGAEVLWTF